MASLWWGLGCLLVAALLAWPAAQLVAECERRRYDLFAPVGWALLFSWLSGSYLFLALILICNYFWPLYPR